MPDEFGFSGTSKGILSVGLGFREWKVLSSEIEQDPGGNDDSALTTRDERRTTKQALRCV